MLKSQLSPTFKKLAELRQKESYSNGTTIKSHTELPEDYFDGDFIWSKTPEGYDFWAKLSECESMEQFVMTEEYKTWRNNNSKKINKKIVSWSAFIFYSLFVAYIFYITCIKPLIK